MSQENVEIFKRGVEVINRRDIDGLLELCAPEIEWQPYFQVIFGGKETVYRGHDGVRQFLGELYDTLPGIHVEFAEIQDLGDRVFAVGRLRATGMASGAEVDAPAAWVADFENGMAVRMRDFGDVDEAREAAGLSE